MVDKDADAVLDEIETAIVLVASSILKGEGFSYTLPSRSKANQLYVPGERRGGAGGGRVYVGRLAWRPAWRQGHSA